MIPIQGRCRQTMRANESGSPIPETDSGEAPLECRARSRSGPFRERSPGWLPFGFGARLPLCSWRCLPFLTDSGKSLAPELGDVAWARKRSRTRRSFAPAGEDVSRRH
jgi:hypothetical protein